MDRELTFVGHLEELRRRIMVSLALIVLAAVFVFPLAPRILAFLKTPASGVIGKLVFFDPAEAFLIHIKIAFFAGMVISMPILFYQLWAFLSPAIGTGMRRRAILFLILSVGAFIGGASFAFTVLLPTALKFLLGFSGGDLEPVISVSSYVSFVLGLILGSGLVFEMPVLSFILSKIGVIDYHFLRRARKYAVIAIFIIAAVITPTPDVFNMTLLAAPMFLLYELSIWVSRFSGVNRQDK